MMSDQNPLDRLLTDARKVFSLAGELGRAFEVEASSHLGSNEQAGHSRFEARLRELSDVLLELRESMREHPSGFGAIGKLLSQAEEITDRVRESLCCRPIQIAPLEWSADLSRISQSGLEAVGELAKSIRLDGGEKIRAGKAFLQLLEDAPEAGIGLQRTQQKLQSFAAAIQMVTSSPEYQALKELERQQVLEMINSLQADHKKALHSLATRHFPRPESLEDWEHIALIAEIPTDKVLSGNLTVGEIRACALAWADRQTIKARLSGAGERAGELEIAQEGASAKRSGRKKADFETIQKEAELAAAWKRAREVGVYKADFARDCKITVSRLDALLDRVAKRNRLSE